MTTQLATDGGPCLGHAEVFEFFRRTLLRGRLASTYLFVGQEGIGKRTAALALARALLCPSGIATSTADNCSCSSCELISAGNHPDLLTIARPEGKSTLPISLFVGDGDKRNREGLCHDISLKPMLGERRIAIIDDADYLSIESGNCLLKTLEEPPPASLIILIATGASRVLPTIRSRCQVVRFRPLPDETVAEVLRTVTEIDDEAELNQLAAAGRGSVARALEADDAELTSIEPEIQAALTGADFDPVALTAQLQELLGGASTDAPTRRRRLQRVIDFAVQTLREDLRQSAAPDRTLRRLDACLDAQQHLERNANQATLVQWWLDQLWRSAPSR